MSDERSYRPPDALLPGNNTEEDTRMSRRYDEILTIRLSRTEKRTADLAAALRGESMSEFGRNAIRRAAEEVLREQAEREDA